jgi:hypothetical protein
MLFIYDRCLFHALHPINPFEEIARIYDISIHVFLYGLTANPTHQPKDNPEVVNPQSTLHSPLSTEHHTGPLRRNGD